MSSERALRKPIFMFNTRNAGGRKFGNKNYSGNSRRRTATKSFYYQSSDGTKVMSRSNSSEGRSPEATNYAKPSFAIKRPSVRPFERNDSARPSDSRRPSFRPSNRPESAGRGFENRRPSSGRPSFMQKRGSRRRFGEAIDVSKFVRKPVGTAEVKEAHVIKNAFADFALSNELQANLKKRQFSTPTPIQDQSINHIIDGRDLIGLANTGTGKTAAFLLPMINKVFKDRSQKVLILAPTRELALQIDNEFREFSWNMKIFSAICVGGAPIYKQINNLRRNPNFVIGTPGRLKDLSDRNLIKFETFNNIVVDEIDRMLDMGFVEEIRNILDRLSKERQSLFFSATMPPKIRQITEQFLVDPVTVEIKSRETAENVDQDIIHVRSHEMKFNQLEEVLKQNEVKKVLIFSETKRDVERLTTDLSRAGFKADSIHGDKKQHQRQRALSSFKTETVNILVATDVAARGLDIDDITHVINYTVPQTYTDYIHRIGRAGRGDKKGFALTFVEGR